MPFQQHNHSSRHADPTLVDISDEGVAELDDGTKLQFPAGTKFRAHPYPENIKNVIIVTPPNPGEGRTEFQVIRGATRSNVEAAIRRCR